MRRYATASRSRGAVALGGDRGLDRDCGRTSADVPEPERDGPEASARHPAQRRPVERRRPADDRGVSRIGFGQPPRRRFHQRNRAQARRRSHLPQGGGRAARRRHRRRDGAGLLHHAATAPVPDEQGQDDLGAAGRPCGRVGHAAGLRVLQPGRRHRQTQRPPPTAHSTVHVTGPAATVADLTVAGEQDRLPIEIAIAVLVLARAAGGVPQPGHHAAAVGDDRGVPGDRTGRGGRRLRALRTGRLEPVHHLSERDHRRRRNGLRGLSHQPLSRLSAARRGFR